MYLPDFLDWLESFLVRPWVYYCWKRIGTGIRVVLFGGVKCDECGEIVKCVKHGKWHVFKLITAMYICWECLSIAEKGEGDTHVVHFHPYEGG